MGAALGQEMAGMSYRGETGKRRPRSPNGAPRRHRVVIKLSDEELARVSARAMLQGLSVPQFYELAAASGDANVAGEIAALREEVAFLRRGLVGVMTNVNQLAHYANTEHHVSQETQAVLEETRVKLATLDALTDALPRVMSSVCEAG